MKKNHLYLIVFISGGAVLAIEILGTRILGPFYGVSLFLWSALITVTLIGLSIGYALGGWWADRGPRMNRLYYVIGAAALWVLLIPWIKRPLLVVAEPLGLRPAVLLAAMVLFLPPLTLLGMVSPYAIRLKASSLEVVGRTAGNLYAVSTVGSVIAALLTGFVLIPNVGVSHLTMLIGAMLALLAAGGLAIRPSRSNVLIALALLAISVVAYRALPPTGADPDNGLIALEHGPYAEIRVVDANNRRYLLIDGGVHTIVDPLSGLSRFPYTSVIDLAGAFFDEPREMLLIGLGGGSIVKNFARRGWEVDAVEIDPVVIEMARAHFDLKASEGRIHAKDGRRFLIDQDRDWALIVMDAFGSSSIPHHLATREAFGLIASRLAPDGVFALNLEADGWRHLIVRSLTATLKAHFEHVIALPAHTDSGALGNVVLLASNTDLEPRLDPEALEFGDRYQVFAWENRFVAAGGDAPVLTDELNPVDIWSERLNLAARRNLHEYFDSESGLSW